MNEQFWLECVEAGCVIAPVKAYEGYVQGDLDESAFVGVRYVALPCPDNDVVKEGESMFFMLDGVLSGFYRELCFSTPQAALAVFKANKE